MATEIKGQYKDNYRCSLTHTQSSTNINTDAPKDNNGKGENFSPTDLLAAGLGSCMVTIIAIRAKTNNISIGKPTFHIRKHMQSSPRKIKRLEVEIVFSEKLSQENRDYLEQEAKQCPVALSISETIEQVISFKYIS